LNPNHYADRHVNSGNALQHGTDFGKGLEDGMNLTSLEYSRTIQVV